MKTDLWSVFLFPDSRCVAGGSLDRMVEDLKFCIARGEPLRPWFVLSSHSSPRAADRYCESAAEFLNKVKFLGGDWFVVRDSAVNEAAQMEGAE
jgi:hypothetical protein